MSKRINIVLPTATIQTIDRFAKKGLRSKFIKTAVEYYVESRSREALRAQLERAAVRDRDLDRQIADEWFAVDQEAWQELDAERPKRSSPSGRSLPYGARPEARERDSKKPPRTHHSE